MADKPNLDVIHRNMDAEDDSARGWWRFGIHFFGFGAVPIIIAGIAHALGAGEGWFVLGAIPTIALGILVITIKEIVELIAGSQKLGKAVIDLFAMILGWIAGVMGWYGWWV